MVTHFSILAKIIPWTEKPDGQQSIGLQSTGRDRMSTHPAPNIYTIQEKLEIFILCLKKFRHFKIGN